MARISESFAGKWLKPEDVGKSLRTVISDVTEEEIGQGEDKKTKLVIWLNDTEKGLVLNKTNGNALAEILGDETDDWAGKKIVLRVEKVNFQGKSVPGIRVDEDATRSANAGKLENSEGPSHPHSRKPAAPMTQAEADELPF